MESKDEFKRIYIKNRTSYYFDDILTISDINFIDILLDGTIYKKTKIF